MFSSKDEDAKKYDVIISGMGLAGLATAWEALNQGKSVLICSDRDDRFLRVQRVYLDSTSRDFLLKMLPNEDFDTMIEEDRLFLEEIFSSATLALKDIERFIKRQLDNFKKDKIVFLHKAQISNIYMDKGMVVIKSGEQLNSYEFDYLVGADGHKHHAANVFNENETKKIIYKKDDSPEVKNNISFYITIEPKDDKDTLLLPKGKSFLSTTDDSQRYLCGISLDLHSYEKSNHKKLKCSIAAEIPPSLFKKSDKELLEYIQPMIKRYITNTSGKGELQIHIVPSRKNSDKDKLKAQRFDIVVEQANQAAVQDEKNGKAFILVGDAFRTPIYQFGHGANNAFTHAKMVGMILANKMTITQYIKKCSNQAKSVSNLSPFLNGKSWYTFFKSLVPYKTDFAMQSEIGAYEEMQEWLAHNEAKDLYNKFKSRLDTLHAAFNITFENGSPEMQALLKLNDSIEATYHKQSDEFFLKNQKLYEDKIQELELMAYIFPNQSKRIP